MKIILLCFGIWIFKNCFALIAENPGGSLWLVPAIFLIGFVIAALALKIVVGLVRN